MFLSRLLIASAIKGSFLHLCLAFNSIRFSPAPFILIGKFQNTDTGLPLLLHQLQKRLGAEPRRPLEWLRCSDCNVPRGDSWKPLPWDAGSFPLCLMLSCHTELPASCLLPAPLSQNSHQAPFPGPAMTRAGKVSWLCSRGPWPPT